MWHELCLNWAHIRVRLDYRGTKSAEWITDQIIAEPLRVFNSLRFFFFIEKYKVWWGYDPIYIWIIQTMFRRYTYILLDNIMHAKSLTICYPRVCMSVCPRFFPRSIVLGTKDFVFQAGGGGSEALFFGNSIIWIWY